MTGGIIGTGAGGAVELPDSAVTEGFAVLARRRSGKSNLAGVIEETFCERGDPWVVLDPVSAHWGIRYQDDGGQPGKPSGYDVLIVGGKYGDVALDERGGGALAQILVDTDISCVVDLGAESMNAQQKFVADFAAELLRINETPRHVLLEEAHTFVPQVPSFENQKLVLGALTKMITMGGGKGIGYSLITQRSASIAKSVLEQIDNLFVLRMSGPRDLKAVQDWFEHNVGDPADMKRILGTLRGFAPGEAWWLSDTALERLTVRLRHTYHAGRTPKRGETMITPKRVELREVIGQYRKAAEKRAIAVQEERDLKAENAALRKQLAAKAPVVVACNHADIIAQHEREKAEITEAVVALDARVQPLYEQSQKYKQHLADIASGLRKVADDLDGDVRNLELMDDVDATLRGIARPKPHVAFNRRQAPATPPVRAKPSANGHALGLSTAQQKIIDTLAVLESIGVERPHKSIVAVFAGVSPTSGGYFNNLGRLRTMELIDYPEPSAVALTAGGRHEAAPGESIATLAELHDAWCRRVSGAQAAIIRAVVAIYPNDIAKDELAEQVNVSPTSGGYFNNLGRLRSLGALDYPAPGRVVATALLFPEGVR